MARKKKQNIRSGNHSINIQNISYSVSLVDEMTSKSKLPPPKGLEKSLTAEARKIFGNGSSLFTCLFPVLESADTIKHQNYLVFIDIDNATQLSKKYGARMFQNILKTFERLIVNEFGNRLFVRIGSDEYIGLCLDMNFETVAKSISSLNATIKNYEWNLHFGKRAESLYVSFKCGIAEMDTSWKERKRTQILEATKWLTRAFYAKNAAKKSNYCSWWLLLG